MEPVLSYNFAEIEYTVRQEIHSTSARLNAALDELRAQIAPLQEIWTREAAEAYRLEQAKWDQAAAALNEILFSLGNAVRDGADDVAATDRSAASAWDTVGLERPLRRASSARDTEPAERISSSTARSLIARSRLGVPGENAGSIPTASRCRIVRKLS